MTEKSDAEAADAGTAFPVVGLGASAGGVEALSSFFAAVPAGSGMAYVVVTHVGPGHDAMLHEILGRHAAIRIRRATDGQELQPDHAYVLSAAAALTVHGNRLRLADRDVRQRHPIDSFLVSLAEDRGPAAIGVLLSGGGTDGTLGLQAIRQAGGLTVAQGSDGAAPAQPSMPDSAIAAGTVDLALPVQDIPARLAAHARSLTQPDALAGAAAAQAAPALGELRRAICEVLRAQLGHDFSGYKEASFLRRVQRRMHVRQLQSPAAYLERLRQDPEEVGRLFQDLLINVTSFFRDHDAFEMLGGTVLPEMLEGRGADATIRIWVPGCATGEEAYSIAMLLREWMDGLRAVPQVQIFATDIDEAALGIARSGRYPAALLAGTVSPERQRRFFVADGDSVVVSRELRELCVFSAHSVIRDPPFSRLDLISCRNLLIYLGAEVQRRLMPLFHYALRPGGWLFLGTSEGIGAFGDFFAPVERSNRIFRRRDRAIAGSLPLWAPELRPGPGHPDERRRLQAATLPALQLAERRLLKRFVPAHVVVNRDADALHYGPGIGRYLEIAAGTPSRNVIGLAQRGLRLDLRAALQATMETRRPTRRDGGEAEVQGLLQPVSIVVEPIAEEQSEPLFLVLFLDQGPPQGAVDPERPVRDGGELAERLELRESRDRLQSTIEEYETALEALKSANEELVSMNEELQSTNEEMQTAKEEQQSVNEELQTVNLDLHDKIEALDGANADLRNLFESTQVATIFLDGKLVIRSFTPSTTEVFNLIPGDRGRPLTDITSGLDYPALREDVEAVLHEGRVRERQVARRDGTAHYLARIAPYRRADGSTAGVIATFAVVTSVVRAASHQRVLVAELNHRVKNTLAVVLGIAGSSLPASPGRDAFVARLKALARAHDLLARDGWAAVPLAEILRAEAAPYLADGRERFSLSGPELSVTPRVAQSLAMVLHEMATNATKFGALSAEAGHVAVCWSLGEQAGVPHLLLDWRELDGPEAPVPVRRGFGSRVIEREVRAGLHGEVTLQFGACGLHARIDFPLDIPLAHAGDCSALMAGGAPPRRSESAGLDNTAPLTGEAPPRRSESAGLDNTAPMT